MKAKFCEVCDKVFFSRSESRVHCSKECRHEAVLMRREKNVDTKRS